MGKVVGLGVFFRAQDTKALRQWYLEILGVEFHPDYLFTSFSPVEMAEVKNATQVFSLIDSSSPYIDPSKKDFMLNLVVDDIGHFIEKLKSANVEILWQDLESDHGKFLHIMDPEGHKIELWQPV